jgi:hypothetical protein
VLVRRPDGSPVCVKRYRCRGRWDALLGALGRSRARLAWRNADRLREHGFAVLRPVALFEEKASLLIKDSYLISPALDHRTRLDHYIAEHFAEPLPPAALRQKRRLLRSLARFLRDLHEQGIYYREMQIDNFFVEERETGKLGNWAAKQGKLGNQHQPPEPDFLISQLPSATSGTPEWNFLFVDFDRVVFGKRLSFPQRAKNLAVLRATCQMLIPQCVSETDQVRFSLAYLEGTALRRRARELLAQARELTARYLRLDQ